MTLPLAIGRRSSAMAEEFENYEARLGEARRAVERWETEGGGQETEEPVERASNAKPGAEQAIPPGDPGGVTHDGGEATER